MDKPKFWVKTIAVNLSAADYAVILYRVIAEVEHRKGQVDDGFRRFNFIISGLSREECQEVFDFLIALIEKAGGIPGGCLYEEINTDSEAD